MSFDVAISIDRKKKLKTQIHFNQIKLIFIYFFNDLPFIIPLKDVANARTHDDIRYVIFLLKHFQKPEKYENSFLNILTRATIFSKTKPTKHTDSQIRVLYLFWNSFTCAHCELKRMRQHNFVARLSSHFFFTFVEM